MKERIQKILANAGIASRRNIETMVRDGRISVNGRLVTSLPVLVDPKKDTVEVDGDALRLAKPADTGPRLYFILNKPKGVYSTNVAQGAQVRAIDLLPPDIGGRLYPVGRLDAESHGLLLLTNDGDLTNQLTHPRYGVAKTYRAVVDGYVGPEMIQQLEGGVWLAKPKGRDAQKTTRSHIRVVHRTRKESVLELTIREGRNRQVRRMLAQIGHKVRDLMRVKMGPLTLHGLALGHFRPLTPQELRQLRQLPEQTPETKPHEQWKKRPPGKPTPPKTTPAKPAGGKSPLKKSKEPN